MKDDIDKLNQQIHEIQEAEEKRNKKPNKKGEPPVEEEIQTSDTKKLDSIQDIEKQESTEVEDDTKKVETVEEVVEPPKEEVIEEKPEVVEPPQEKKPKKNPLLYILIGIVACLFIVLFLVLLFPKQNSSVKEETDKTLSQSEQRQVLKNYGDAVKGMIGVYQEKKSISLTYEEAADLVQFDYDIVCQEHEVYEDGSLYLNQCSIDGIETEASYGKKQKKKEIIVPEGAVKVYVSKDGKASFEKPSSGEYDTYGIEINEAYTDLEFLDASNSLFVRYVTQNGSEVIGHIVNYKTGKKAFPDGSYDSIMAIKINGKYDTRYAAINKKVEYGDLRNNWGIVDIVNNRQVVSTQYGDMGFSLSSGLSQAKYYFETVVEKEPYLTVKNPYAYYNEESPRMGIINYQDGMAIIPLEYPNLYVSNNYFFARNGKGYGYIFDQNGKKQLKDKYDNIYWMSNDKNILVQDGDSVKVVDINGKELYNFGEYSFVKANYGISSDDGMIVQFPNGESISDHDFDLGDSCLEFIYRNKTGEVKETPCDGLIY